MKDPADQATKQEFNPFLVAGPSKKPKNHSRLKEKLRATKQEKMNPDDETKGYHSDDTGQLIRDVKCTCPQCSQELLDQIHTMSSGYANKAYKESHPQNP